MKRGSSLEVIGAGNSHQHIFLVPAPIKGFYAHA